MDGCGCGRLEQTEREANAEMQSREIHLPNYTPLNASPEQKRLRVFGRVLKKRRRSLDLIPFATMDSGHVMRTADTQQGPWTIVPQVCTV